MVVKIRPNRRVLKLKATALGIEHSHNGVIHTQASGRWTVPLLATFNHWEIHPGKKEVGQNKERLKERGWRLVRKWWRSWHGNSEISHNPSTAPLTGSIVAAVKRARAHWLVGSECRCFSSAHSGICVWVNGYPLSGWLCPVVHTGALCPDSTHCHTYAHLHAHLNTNQAFLQWQGTCQARK